MRVLAVIPARGGSKGVHQKNIRPLNGRPLIAWSIEASKQSTYVTRTIVSTDDETIAQVAREYGADVPFMRPVELASDSAKSMPVMQHALAAVEASGDAPYDALLMLQPTTPLRTSEDIDTCIALLRQTPADSVISVMDVGGTHPARMKYLEAGRLVDPPFCEAYENQPRQELKTMYIRNGAIYLTRRETLLAGSFKGKDCRGHLMDEARSVNIDTPMDFEYAEFLVERAKRAAKL